MTGILTKYATIFKDMLDGHIGTEVHVPLTADACREFLKCQQVPFILHKSVLAELQKLENQGILEPVQASSWATPVVVV